MYTFVVYIRYIRYDPDFIIDDCISVNYSPVHLYYILLLQLYRSPFLS